MKIKEPFIPLQLAKFSYEILASYQAYLKITPIASNQKLSVIQSKFSGIPYWPESSLKYPTDLNSKKMHMVAQINFAELQNAIGPCNSFEHFPQQGLLQFFLPIDLFNIKTLENSCNKEVKQFNDIDVIYHPSTELPNAFNETLKEKPLNDSNTNSLTINESELKFFLEYQFCPLTDYHHAQYFYGRFLNQLIPQEEKLFYESEEFDSSGCKMDGYTNFPGHDNRMGEYDESNPWILLLQIDNKNNNASKSLSMLSNGAIANWFIRKNDLINKDFSKVIFNMINLT